MMIPPVHTAAYRAYRAALRDTPSKLLTPPPEDRVETVLTLWDTGLFDTLEISARTGLSEPDVDRIISADIEARHG